jgi:hypothetical protein
MVGDVRLMLVRASRAVPVPFSACSMLVAPSARSTLTLLTLLALLTLLTLLSPLIPLTLLVERMGTIGLPKEAPSEREDATSLFTTGGGSVFSEGEAEAVVGEEGSGDGTGDVK